MKLFAVSTMYHNLRTGVTYHAPSIVTSPSKYELEGVLLEQLVKEFPPEQQWTGHSVNVTEITLTHVLQYLTILTTKDN